MDRFFIGKMGVSKVNLTTATQFLNESVANRDYGYVCVTNSRATYIANHEPDYLSVQNGSLFSVPDGMPLVWIAHNRGLYEISKVSGQDLMDAIFKISVEKGYSHYFYGCSEKTLVLLERNLLERYPGLEIRGLVSPPFQPLINFDIPALTAEVNALKPTFFWCGLGCPKQERLIAMLQPHLNETISIGVGLAFEYYAETVKRAPVWMQKNGVEWVYRLYKQPDRITYLSMKRMFSILIPLTKSFLSKLKLIKEKVNNNNILTSVGILDGQSVQAIVFAKQLTKSGYDVVLFCDSKLSYGYHTKYAHKRVLCPSTQKETSKFHDFFLNYLENEKLDVVIPMNDYSAKYLSKYKLCLQDKVKFSIPDFSVFMKGYDKNQLMKLCAENNLPHPKTIDISKLEKDTTPDFNFLALIKPNETTGARGFRKVKNFSELWQVYGAIFSEFGNCHLQELIPNGGMQYKVQLLMKNRIIVNSTVIEKHRYYPVNGGSSCFNHTIVNDEMVKTCTKVLQIIGWEGFADFDLIEDPRDGIIKIMEINPRAPACIKASVISGVDFPNAIVDLSLNRPITTYTYKPDKYLRYFSMDLLWLMSQKSKWEGFKKWKRQLFSKRHFLQDGELSDPMPFIVGALSGIAKQMNPEFRAKKSGM